MHCKSISQEMRWEKLCGELSILVSGQLFLNSSHIKVDELEIKLF